MGPDGGARRQTEPNVQGIHDNPVSGNYQTLPSKVLGDEGPVNREGEGPRPQTFQAPIPKPPQRISKRYIPSQRRDGKDT